ncbi:MAG: hypothetical protein ABIZ36_05260 [Gemmatimonadaceae bacterium]
MKNGRISFGTVVVLVTMGACTPELATTTSEPIATIRAGRLAPTTDMSVTSATPDSATQDTTLDVAIGGSGFVAGTSAAWALGGVQDAAQVRTNSTRYVNSRQLVANITISKSALISKWDIVVSAAGRKGGIGTEAFAIKAKRVSTDTKANIVWDENVNVAPTGQPAVWAPALITGDYRKRDGSAVTDGSSGEFQHNFCGSDSYMQSTTTAYPQAALNFDPDHLYDPATMDAACGGKRYYQIFFSGRTSAPLNAGPQHYALRLGDLAVGQTLIEEVHFGIQQTNCSALRFDDVYPPASNARVTRLTDTTTATGVTRRWSVQSEGSHRAMCTLFTNKGPKSTGISYYLPFSFTVTEIHSPFPAFP